VEDDLVGRGKTASVYRAIWIVAEVALKKWNYHSLTDKLLNSFLDEVHTLRALNHPNIVRFVGACREPFLALVTGDYIKLTICLIHF
jgi:serine/threonine protein kinase